jgi:hypothetical protein
MQASLLMPAYRLAKQEKAVSAAGNLYAVRVQERGAASLGEAMNAQ